MISGRNRCAPCSSPGYTLLEISIALLIASLIAGACIPAFINWRMERQLKGPITSLDVLVQHARQDAISTGLPVKLNLNPEGFTYGDDHVTLEKGVRLRAQILGDDEWIVPGKLTFSVFPTGLCEPCRFEFSLDNGSFVRVNVDALTGSIEEDESYIR